MLDQFTDRSRPNRVDAVGADVLAWLLQPSLSWNATVIALFSLACTVALAATLLIPNATYVSTMLHDLFVFIDGGYRMLQGHLPYIDFHSFFGVLAFLLPKWGYQLTGTFGAAMPATLVFCLAFLTPIAIYVFATRFRFYIALPLALYLLLLVATPTLLDGDETLSTMAMWYNRFGWSALILLFLLYAAPFAGRRRTELVDGLVIGAILISLFYLKISYAMVALAFVIIWAALEKDSRTSVLIGIVFLVATGLTVELIWKLHAGYARDVLMAVEINSAIRGGILKLVKIGFRNTTEILLAVGAWGLLVATGMTKLRDHVIFLFIVGSSLAILSQNAQKLHLPCLVAIIAIAAERLARETTLANIRTRWRGLFTVLAFFLLFGAQPTVNQGVAMAKHFDGAMRTPTDTDLPEALARVHVAAPTGQSDPIRKAEMQRLVAERDFDQLRTHMRPKERLFQIEYLHTILKGLEALETIDLRGKSLTTLDFANPFSFILGLTPPRGDTNNHHVNRTISRDIYVDPDSYFAQADIVMVPKRAVSGSTRDQLWNVYGDYIGSHYKVAVETDFWTIWSKAGSG